MTPEIVVVDLDIESQMGKGEDESIRTTNVTSDEEADRRAYVDVVSPTAEDSPSSTTTSLQSDSSSSSSLPTSDTVVVVEPPPKKMEHLGKHRQYWRDILLGVNDGIISTFLLVAGVAGGGLDATQILLTALAGTVAGAVSMCAGEYLATKSQNEVLEGEIKLERSHVIHHRDEEIQELADLLQVIGMDVQQVELRQQVLQYYDSHPDALLKAMVALEFGVLEEEQRSPIIAGLTNLALFTVGAMPSVLPFVIVDAPKMGLILAAVLTVLALLLVGVIKTWATRGNCLTAAAENLVIATIGGGFAFGVGLLFERVVGVSNQHGG